MALLTFYCGIHMSSIFVQILVRIYQVPFGLLRITPKLFLQRCVNVYEFLVTQIGNVQATHEVLRAILQK